jgi:hypothetical protein
MSNTATRAPSLSDYDPEFNDVEILGEEAAEVLAKFLGRKRVYFGTVGEKSLLMLHPNTKAKTKWEDKILASICYLKEHDWSSDARSRRLLWNLVLPSTKLATTKKWTEDDPLTMGLAKLRMQVGRVQDKKLQMFYPNKIKADRSSILQANDDESSWWNNLASKPRDAYIWFNYGYVVYGMERPQENLASFLPGVRIFWNPKVHFHSLPILTVEAKMMGKGQTKRLLQKDARLYITPNSCTILYEWMKLWWLSEANLDTERLEGPCPILLYSATSIGDELCLFVVRLRPLIEPDRHQDMKYECVLLHKLNLSLRVDITKWAGLFNAIIAMAPRYADMYFRMVRKAMARNHQQLKNVLKKLDEDGGFVQLYEDGRHYIKLGGKMGSMQAEDLLTSDPRQIPRPDPNNRIEESNEDVGKENVKESDEEDLGEDGIALLEDEMETVETTSEECDEDLGRDRLAKKRRRSDASTDMDTDGESGEGLIPLSGMALRKRISKSRSRDSRPALEKQAKVLAEGKK